MTGSTTPPHSAGNRSRTLVPEERGPSALSAGKIPGDFTDTTITFIYKIAFTYRLDPGEAAALGVLNVAFLIVVVGFYVRRVGISSEEPGAGLTSVGSGRGRWATFRERLADSLVPLANRTRSAVLLVRRALTADLRTAWSR